MTILPFRRNRSVKCGPEGSPTGKFCALSEVPCGIDIKGATARYGENVVVDEVSTHIACGGITSIIGPNGAGKSTLLQMVARLRATDGGQVSVDGVDVTKAPGKELAKRLAVLRQENFFAVRLTVRELVSFGRFPHCGGRLRDEDQSHVEMALEQMELLEYSDRHLDELSGGQRQRAFIAMVLAQDTEYILLDEPLNNLDLRHARSMMSLLRRVAEESRKTVVVVIHDINMAAAFSDRIIAMRDGRIEADGSPDTIMRTEVLRDIYDMDMEVADVRGRKVALYFDDEVAEREFATA